MLLKQNSLTNKTWIKHPDNHEDFDNAIKTYNIAPLIAKILFNRNINFNEMHNFLNPKLKNIMQDPYVLKDMELSCSILHQALITNKEITILGDYDVDGLTSTTMLYKYLKSLKHNNSNYQNKVNIYIPSRYQEGYGITEKALKNLLKLHPQTKLLILLDNGSSAYNEIKLAKENNLEVIVIDHHNIEIITPEADGLVNPNRVDDESGYNYLCTAGLIFLFLIAFNRYLKDNNFFIDNLDTLPQLMNYLDLAALGTVCDMVPIKGLNRALVLQGIKLMQQRKNIALKCLADSLELNKPVEVETLGFVFGPCINSGSRMGLEQIPLDLLLCENENKASILAHKLKEINMQRQEEENKVIQAAVQEIQANLDNKNNKIKDSKNNQENNENNFIFVGSENWIAGVVGIIAGRIKENHNKPTCVYALKDGIGTASGRSITNVDLGNIITGAKQRDLIIKGGGHSQAVGFSFNIEKKAELFNFINRQINLQLKSVNNISNTILVDEIINLSAINLNFMEQLTRLEPFGMHFNEPILMLSNIKIYKIEQIGKLKNHISLIISDGLKFNMKAFCYKCIPSKLGEILLKNENCFVDLIVTPKLNFYKGKQYINIIIKDIA